jgi:SRSO17 transposase
MNVDQIRQLQPELEHFLHRFDDCFARKDTRAHLPIYITGQLSELPQKSVEPIALEAGVPPRTLQEFLAQLHWDHDRMRDRLQEIVRDEHAGRHSIGLFDETSDVKKGDKTPGVKRQWCGAVGKVENCLVTVHLGFARDDFHCLLDSELFLPEDWAQDRQRCRAAGIPDTLEYRPKWQIALGLYDQALGNGLHFDWMTFDEGYGGKPDFLRGLSERHQRFVGEVPSNFVGWLRPPRVIRRAYRKHGRGRGRKIPRLASGSPPAQRVDQLLERREVRAQPWQRWRIKDTEKGPMVWEVKHLRVTPKDEDGLPGDPLHLIAARDVLNPAVVKFFVSNAPLETPVGPLLLVGFGRWRVERCFEDQKGEIGLDQYEGRRYVGLKRHLALSAVSYLFLARMREAFGGEKSGADGVSGAYGAGGMYPVVVVRACSDAGAFGTDVGASASGATAECGGTDVPHAGDAAQVA